MKKIIFILLFSFIFVPSLAWAETKEIISEGTYNMGDGETPIVAESRALLQAKRGAMEQAGTYIESYTKVKNFQVTEDEIQVIASGIIEIEVLDKKRTIVGDGINFWVRIKARVSTDKIEEMAKRVKEKNVIEDYKKIQAAYNKQAKEIEKLKKQLVGAKTEKKKKQIVASITEEERTFQATEWSDKGYKYSLNKEYDAALEAYTSAIALNPNYVKAYYNRSIIYMEKGQYDRAIEDCNKAIALNPNYAGAYANRGFVYLDKAKYDKAIEDFSKAIALNPNYADTYNNRGIAYDKKGQHDEALEDYNKAIALKPNLADAYNNRGVTYAEKGQYNKAVENFNQVIALKPNYAKTYNLRGGAYFMSGNKKRAISDFQKACDMGHENGCKALQIVFTK